MQFVGSLRHSFVEKNTDFLEDFIFFLRVINCFLSKICTDVIQGFYFNSLSVFSAS